MVRRRSNRGKLASSILGATTSRSLEPGPATSSWTGTVSWENLSPVGRTLRILELVVVELEDPDHPLRIIDDADRTDRTSAAKAIEEVIELIRDAADRFAHDHKIILSS
jgi:hypothetical protein